MIIRHDHETTEPVFVAKMEVATFLLVTALLHCFSGGGATQVFQNFINEVKPPFSQALNQLDNLVQVAIAESSKYDANRPIDESYFRNPAIQNAISATHTPLTQAQAIAQRHVNDYANLISQQTGTIGSLEGTINNHRNEIATLNQSKASLQATLASVQESINHNQKMLDDNRAQLDHQQRNLARRKKRRRLFKWISVLVPPAGIGYIITDKDVKNTEGRIRELENIRNGHQQSKQNAEASLNQVNAQIAANENAIATASAQLQQTQASLNSLKQERDVILQLGEKLKSSTLFVTEFQGKVHVLHDTNRITIMFDAIITSLENLLSFISANLENQIAVLATAQSLERIRQLLAATRV